MSADVRLALGNLFFVVVVPGAAAVYVPPGAAVNVACPTAFVAVGP